MDNFFTKSLGAVPIRKSDVVEKDRAASLLAWEKRERAPFDRLLDVKSAQGQLDSAINLATIASAAIEEAGKSKDRDQTTKLMIDAHKNILRAKEISGLAGDASSGEHFLSASQDIFSNLDRLHRDKGNTLDANIVDSIKSKLRTAGNYLQSKKDAYQSHYEEGGKGAIPGLRALQPQEASRSNIFNGGIELRLLREDVRRHLHRVGFGRVDQTARDPYEHELWESPDGKTVRLSYERMGDNRKLTVKERGSNNWRSTRTEFKNSYYGNPNLDDGDAKPGIPPKGVKVAISSEIPFMPIDRPKGKKAGA
jgi:hypothetical protein